MKSILFILSVLFYLNTVKAQNGVVYVIFTSYNKETIGEGVDKSLCKPSADTNYPSIYFEIQSVKNDYLFPFIHSSIKNLKKDVTNPIMMTVPQSFLKNYQAQLVDWDVVGPTLNYLQVSQKIKQWEKADKIYFIDRKDFFNSGSTPLMKVVEVERPISF